MRVRAGDYERDGTTGLLLPSHAKRKGIERAHPQFMTGPAFFAGDVGGGGASDAYWANRVALLHFDGSNGSTSYTDSKGIVSWTAGGTSALTTTSPKFGTAQFDSGSGGHAIAAYNSAFNVAGVPFCFEGFLTMTTMPASQATLLSWNANTGTYAQMRLDVRSTGKLALLVNTSVVNTWYTTTDATITGGSVSAGTRVFVRAGRDASSNSYIEIDGTVVVSYLTAVTIYNYSGNTLIGGYQNTGPTGRAICRWDEIRFSVGRDERGQPVPTAAFPNS